MNHYLAQHGLRQLDSELHAEICGFADVKNIGSRALTIRRRVEGAVDGGCIWSKCASPEILLNVEIWIIVVPNEKRQIRGALLPDDRKRRHIVQRRTSHEAAAIGRDRKHGGLAGHRTIQQYNAGNDFVNEKCRYRIIGILVDCHHADDKFSVWSSQQSSGKGGRGTAHEDRGQRIRRGNRRWELHISYLLRLLLGLVEDQQRVERIVGSGTLRRDQHPSIHSNRNALRLGGKTDGSRYRVVAQIDNAQRCALRIGDVEVGAIH